MWEQSATDNGHDCFYSEWMGWIGTDRAIIDEEIIRSDSGKRIHHMKMVLMMKGGRVDRDVQFAKNKKQFWIRARRMGWLEN